MAIIDEVKQKLDIVEIVSQSVPLQKAGRNFKALCPFHSEKTPSFYVFPERQSWHCFGACNSGGDVFSFIMKKENLPFGEALMLLSKRAGVELAPLKEEGEQDKRLYQITEAAAQYFHHTLLYTPGAETARQHLKERGVSLDSLVRFRLGYSPEAGRTLKRHLSGQGFEEEELLTVGLITKREGEESYDLFRRRLIFPICDPQGRVVGFGGRVLDDSSPKYLNSAGSRIFDKSSLLYGLDQAKSAIRKQDKAVLVEGYMDVIIAHQYGFNYVVGTMGTSLTEKQFLALKKFTQNPILALDADPAGSIATLRGVEIATRTLEHTVKPIPDWRGMIRYESVLAADIRVMPLPQGKDPDEVIRENPQAWQGMVEEAKPVMDYLMESLVSQTDMSQAGQKSSLVKRLKPLFDEVKDPLRWAHYVQKLARLIRVEERFLTGALRRPSSKTETEAEIPLPSHHLEGECLAILLQNQELIELGQKLQPQYFQESQNREVFQAWLKSPDLPSLKEILEPALQDYVDSLVNHPIPPLAPKEKERVFVHCLAQLKENFLRFRLEAAAEESLVFQEQGKYPFPEELSAQCLELSEELRQTFIEKHEKGA